MLNSDDSQSAHYQRFRLWSGICSIGCNLGIIWAFAAFFTFVNSQIVEKLPVWLWLLAPVLTFLAFGFVFDLLSGHVAERAFGKSAQSQKQWRRDWLQTAPRAAFGLYFFLLLLSFLASVSPVIRVLIVSCLPACALVLAGVLPRFVPRNWQTERPEFEERLWPELEKLGVARVAIRWFGGENERECNGTIPPMRREIWLSTGVADQLEPREAALLIARDFFFTFTQKTARAVLICALWLAVGTALALSLPPFFLPLQSSPLAFATTGAALSTTWCFAALFVWPRLNQKWMREADRSLLEHAGVDELAALFHKVQSLNSSDSTLSDAKSGIFHPIPELARRLENLR